jgi:hypothetical protein
MVLHPRHRGDCEEFFVAPHQTARVQFDGPTAVIGKAEHRAAVADST